MGEPIDSQFFSSRTDEPGPGRWSTPTPPGAGRPEGSGDVWSRYQCPVCGHQDRVTLSGGSANIECSHCLTPLVVSLPSPSSERVTVRVDLESPRS